VIDEDAFVYQQLKDAGAVLIAKLSMGELAMDDIWFGGQTKNPWNLQQGSNGSSAGSASATVGIGTFCHWYRNLRLYCSTFCGVWCNRVASNIWQCCPNWGHEPCGPPTVLDQFAAALKIVHWYSLPYMVIVLHELPFNYTDKIELKT
jgi:hypothetical protein